MKVRSDFVSNSSSSSFIISGDEECFSHLTKKDFVEAIKSLTNNKINKYFKVFDKTLKKDFNKLNSSYTNWLKEWQTPYLYGQDGFCMFTPEYSEDCGKALEKWDSFYSKIRSIYDYLPFSWNPSITTYSHYSKKTDKFTEKKINKSILTVLNDAYKHYGIMSNHDVLMCEFSRFLIHFADNEVYEIAGMTDPSKNEDCYEKPDNQYQKEFNEKVKNSIWETDSYTPLRFCEVLLKWFKDNNRIPADSNLSWKDFSDTLVACTMHEG